MSNDIKHTLVDIRFCQVVGQVAAEGMLGQLHTTQAINGSSGVGAVVQSPDKGTCLVALAPVRFTAPEEGFYIITAQAGPFTGILAAKMLDKDEVLVAPVLSAQEGG